MSQTTASSDYFDDDPEFVKALAEVNIPELQGNPDVQAQGSFSTPSVELNDLDLKSEKSRDISPLSPQAGAKRRRYRSPSSEGEYDGVQSTSHHNAIDFIDHDQGQSKSSYLSSDTYGASRFGDFGEYMHRKRQKLQIQNSAMDDSGPNSQSFNLFQGLQIYINGWTEPSVQELRKMIVQYGGAFHAYLDKKSLVTHIITCSLTPAKIREFQHMKVATPDWLVKSVEAGVLLPWYDFKYEPNKRLEATQGKKAPQKSLLSDFVSQSALRTATQSQRAVAEQAADDFRQGSYRPSKQVVLVAEPAKPPVTAVDALVLPRPHKPQITSATTTPARPLQYLDPPAPDEDEAARAPAYAADKSNVAAQRAMADPAWRAAHTSVAPDFIEGYYRNSRLHHLSTWKAELRHLVSEAQERSENRTHEANASSLPVAQEDNAVTKVMRENMDGKNWVGSGADEDVSMKGARLVKGKGKEKAADDGERVIMHCDFDSFFVSAGLVDRPHLKGKPVVVCHSHGAQGGQSSTSEIASASYEARKFGVKSGMSLQQARALCSGIVTIPYEFQRYKEFSLQFYTILMAHADDLQAVSVDEALLDVTSSVRRIRTEISLSQSGEEDSPTLISDPAKDFAEAIRTQVRNATGCEVSIGIAHNVMLARLASRKAKPAGSFHLLPTNVSSFMENLDIDDLHGFGYATHQKAQEKLGATSLRELAKKSKAVLCDALGKGTGETLYKALRGIDDKKLESDKPRRSVSCDINYGIRFENNEQAEAFIYQLSEEVSRRLRDISTGGRSLTLKIMKRDPSAPVEAPKFMGHGICETFTKQVAVIAPGGRATSDAKIIGDHAWKLLKGMNFDPKELRGVAIQMQKLEKSDVASSEGDQEQKVLPFRPLTSPKKERIVDTAERQGEVDAVVGAERSAAAERAAGPVAGGGASAGIFDLPSFSQVDKSVFDALPEDLRAELEAEYKRRSVTPAIPDDPGPMKRARSASVFREPWPRKRKIVVKGTSNLNVKHITRQLAPKSRAGLSPKKTTLFQKPIISNAIKNSVKLKMSEEELRQLDIDPEVFKALPPGVQREQLALARHSRAPITLGVTAYFATQRKVLKPAKRTRRLGTPGIVIPPPPPPRAYFPEPPSLKQRGKNKGEKFYFTEAEDIQDVVEKWFNAFREKAPNAKDVEFFETWLVRCVDGTTSTDGGLEKGIKVMKWWQVLLRREFGVLPPEEQWTVEPRTPEAGVTSLVNPGRAWWLAFNNVKAKMDSVSRAKFGGRLSLR